MPTATTNTSRAEWTGAARSGAAAGEHAAAPPGEAGLLALVRLLARQAAREHLSDQGGSSNGAPEKLLP